MKSIAEFPGRMQSDNGKLFIGGISWDTNEERLKEYFSSFGEVVEAVIMKDRTTGRARGFGFVVFSDPTIADRVIKEKHSIDGRMVEAKKAIPRDNQTIPPRSSTSTPSPGHSRKIFVGGLPSSVTESDFKTYFDQFGTITDVVVMYDHNTQRPRGFGFITYDSDDSVDKVLTRTFHELNGKMVEVKRAVPKELSPSPLRSPMEAHNYGISRINSFFNGYTQGGYGLRMDGRFTPVSVGLSTFSPVGSNLNLESSLSPSFARGMNMSQYFVNNTNRFGGPYEIGNSSFFSRNLWGNGISSSASSPQIGSSGNNWSSSVISRGNHLASGDLGFGYVADNTLNVEETPFRRNQASPRSSSAVNFENSFLDFYGGASDSWRSEREEISPFSYAVSSNDKTSPGFVGGFSVNKRQPTRGPG